MRTVLVYAPLITLVGVCCCGYSTRSLIPSHLHTVAVMPAENTTSQPGLGEEMTDSLVAAFGRDRTLRVSSTDDADLIVATTLVGYSRNPAAYTGEQVINAYELAVSASVLARDVVRDEDFFRSTVSTKLTYDPTSETEEKAASSTISRLCSEIVRQILAAW